MKTLKRVSLGSVLLGSALAANATAPAYITDAITTATTTFTDYISAAAPGLFSIITIVAGLFLVVKLLKKSTH